MLADRPDCRDCNSEIAVCTAAAWSGWNQIRSIHRFGQRRQRLPNNKAGRSSLEAFTGREELPKPCRSGSKMKEEPKSWEP